MIWRSKAVWVGYPTAAHIESWTPALDVDDAHPAAEGIEP